MDGLGADGLSAHARAGGEDHGRAEKAQPRERQLARARSVGKRPCGAKGRGLAEGFDHTPGGAIPTTAIALPVLVGPRAMLGPLRRLQRELALLASSDVLTGLPNRRALTARAATAVRDGCPGALLVLDADRFKQVNDTWGHAVGDACLQAIGARLARVVHPGGRRGAARGRGVRGFLPGAGREEVAALGERLCQAVAVEAAGAAALEVTLSAGAALDEGRLAPDRLLARADHALHQAKAAGRARLVVWPGSDGPIGLTNAACHEAAGRPRPRHLLRAAGRQGRE